jgi:hypothetical protein
MMTTTENSAPKQGALAFTFSIDGIDYRVTPLPIDPAVGSKAFRFAKQAGDEAVYDLYLDRYGLQCECKGFLRHGHCKHVHTLQAAGAVFDLS